MWCKAQIRWEQACLNKKIIDWSMINEVLLGYIRQYLLLVALDKTLVEYGMFTIFKLGSSDWIELGLISQCAVQSECGIKEVHDSWTKCMWIMEEKSLESDNTGL